MTEEMEYREVPVVGGYVALVDPDKFAEIAQYKWHSHKHRSGAVYAVRYVSNAKGNQTTILMHRQVLRLEKNDRRKVAHKEATATMDNRLANLLVGCREGSNWKPRLCVVPEVPGQCPVCSKEFKTYPSRVKGGRGKFCSRKCHNMARTVLPPRFIPAPAVCQNCGHTFMKRRKDIIYCAKRCEQQASEKRYFTNPIIRSAQLSGEIAELRVVIDLLSKGYWVFKPVVFGCGYDYIAIRGDEIERVEVKVGRMHMNTGRVDTNRPKNTAYTMLAIVIDGLILYERREVAEEGVA